MPKAGMLGRHVTPDRRSEMAAPRKAKLCLGGICSSFCYVLALVALCAFVGLTVFRQDYLDGMVQQQIDHVGGPLAVFFVLFNIFSVCSLWVRMSFSA